MAIPKKIYFKIRSFILPIGDILKWIPINACILDLGCGKGILANYIKNFNTYLGVDLVVPLSDDAKIKFKKSNCLNFINNDISKYNTFLIIDLLHHIPKKLQESFLFNLTSKMKSGDILIIKDINPKNLFTKFCNAFHDLLISKQIIRYFNFSHFEENITSDLMIKKKYFKRIFVYDHYFLILKKI